MAGNATRPVPAGHSHWHALGCPMEMLELNRLQSVLSRKTPIHPGDGAKLEDLAGKAGRADTEAFVAAYGRDGNGEGPSTEAWETEFDCFRQGEYWRAIDFSEKILSRIDGIEIRLEAAAEVCRNMREAYERGRATIAEASRETKATLRMG